jgi:pyruvate formate lyase activating enzyme
MSNSAPEAALRARSSDLSPLRGALDGFPPPRDNETCFFIFRPNRGAMNRAPLREMLEAQTAPMTLGSAEAGGKVRCVACGHRCLIPAGHAGVCRVRFNRDGELRGPWGYVAGVQDDPIEKKPFYHALPGTRALSFGMLGCDFHCGYCQNWVTSQALRDEVAGTTIRKTTPGALAALARQCGALTVTSTYNEPLITTEWGVAIFRDARALGLRTSFVSNGNNTAEAIAHLKPWCDFYKVDLKSFDDAGYRKLGGTLKSVLDGIERVYRAGIWLEVLTLVVPGFNDSETQLGGIAGFLAEISLDIPWHVTAFHPDYKMTDRDATPARSLLLAAEIGKGAGLRYVYAGNLPGKVSNHENTYCPHCEALLIERRGFALRRYLIAQGACPQCRAPIPGRWHDSDTLPALQTAEQAHVRPLGSQL